MSDRRDNSTKGDFWSEIAPSEHLVQLYDHDAVMLDSLAGFVAAGLRAGEGVIVILTAVHREALEDRLHGFESLGHFSLSAARARDQYIAADAEDTLATFMVNGQPSESLFRKVAGELLTRARAAGWWGGDGRQVRAFGEMVALLWDRGQEEATLRLEELWHSLCAEERFSLFCAYPKASFDRDPAAAARICAAHSRVICGR